MNERPTVRVFTPEGSEEFMVQWPSGQVEFIGLWAMVKLAWWCAKTGTRVVVVDPKTNKETEA